MLHIVEAMAEFITNNTHMRDHLYNVITQIVNAQVFVLEIEETLAKCVSSHG